MIKKLILKNFRNFKDYQLEINGLQSLIIGPNGSGKSSLLEAVYLLASGQSLRADSEAEMIRLGGDYAKIMGWLNDQEGEVSLDLTLASSSTGSVTKVAQLNSVKKPLSRFWGQFKTVEFSPEDINLVSGSPDLRRRYLNSILNQVSLEYRQSFLAFEKARRQKNSLLDQIREGLAPRRDLEIWNQALLREGLKVKKQRQDYLDFLTGRLEGVGFSYFPSLLSSQRLKEFEEREIAAGSALIGPHRDDFEFMAKGGPLNGLDLGHFGSRGQQRLAVFELKLGELAFFHSQLKTEPLLLLDDIFSELDETHRRQVWQKIANHQVILTSSDEELPEEIKSVNDLTVIRLR